MAVFELGRLHGARDALREWRGSRQLPLYAAALVGGAGLVIGLRTVVDPVMTGDSQRPAEVQAPAVAPRVLPRTAESKPVVPSRDAGALHADVLSGDTPAAPVYVPVQPDPAPEVVAPIAAPVSAPPAAAPFVPPLADTAPPLAVPAAPVAPAATVPEVTPPEPATPARSDFYVPAVQSGPMTNLEQRLFDGMNAERAAAGLPPYVYDARLSTIARTRSQQMVDQGYFGHRDPYGYSMYVELLAYFGFGSYAWAGENLALNNYAEVESPERAVTALMNSATHRSNILQTLFTRVGIGEVTHADGRKYYAMIFLG